MYDGQFQALDTSLGIKSGFCTQENNADIKLRAEKLKLTEFSIFGNMDKVADAQKLLDQYGWEFENLAYVGDDLDDIALLKKAGVAFVVNNAQLVAKEVADYVTEKNGGEGAVREIINKIIMKLKI